MIDFSVEFEVKNVFAAHAMDAFFDEVALQQVKAFERRCRHLYGTGKRKRMPPPLVAAASPDVSIAPPTMIDATPTAGFLFPGAANSQHE